MPRPEGLTGIGDLPLWDTVEALYFLAVGISIGVVFGFLFPSFWRALRRKFRNTERYKPDEYNKIQLTSVEHNSLLSDDIKLDSQISKEPIVAKFVTARNLVQTGKYRDSIKYYLDILSDIRVSKQDTNRVFFELSKVYSSLDLNDRAFDLAYELLSRKPKSKIIFDYLLSIIKKYPMIDNLEKSIKIWKGTVDKKTRKQISHMYCFFAEQSFSSNDNIQAKHYATKATQWDLQSSRARIALWKSTNNEIIKPIKNNISLLWSAFVAELLVRTRIGCETNISTYVESPYLGELISTIIQQDTNLFEFKQISPELLQMIQKQISTQAATTQIANILFYMCLSQHSQPTLHTTIYIAKTLFPNFDISIEINLENYTPKVLSILELGLKSHYCCMCNASFSCFSWECPQCKSFESLVPQALRT